MYLYGASGHAKVIIEILEAGGITVDGLLDDNVQLQQLWEYKVFRPDLFDQYEGNEFVISIGSNKIRQQIAGRLPVHYGKAVHPKAIISRRAAVGDGTVIMGGVTVNADTVIGKHCILNTNASVDHDCRLGDFVHISPNVAVCGGVTIGEGSHIGAGAVIIPGVKIGHWAVIGAGCVVIRNVEDGQVVVGNPGHHKIKTLTNE